jgi:FMN-dependent NADH-azoreductase
MAKILHVKASPRDVESFSNRLAKAFLDSFLRTHKNFEAETLDLFGGSIPEFRAPAAKAKYAILAGAEPADEVQAAWKPVIRTIEHFKSAGAYVISSPMWNFGIPYRLKQYIDVIVQPALTFTYSPQQGYKGLVTGKPLVLCLARGGPYRPGSGAEAFDMQKSYLETIFGFIGFTDIRAITVEPTLQAGPPAAEDALQKAIAQARKTAAELVPVPAA